VYRKQADDVQIPTGTEVAVVYEEIRVGWIKFGEKGQQPERKIGPVFDGFVPPPREELGDLDESKWEIGLSGKPTDRGNSKCWCQCTTSRTARCTSSARPASRVDVSATS